MAVIFLGLKWDFGFLINVRSLIVQESMCLKVNIKANFYNCVLVGGRILLFPKAEGCRNLKMSPGRLHVGRALVQLTLCVRLRCAGAMLCPGGTTRRRPDLGAVGYDSLGQVRWSGDYSQKRRYFLRLLLPSRACSGGVDGLLCKNICLLLVTPELYSSFL